MKFALTFLMVINSLAVSANELSTYMNCFGTNQYDEVVETEVLVAESSKASKNVKTTLVITRVNTNKKMIIDGTIANKPDMLGTYQFISHDNRTRFLTSGSVYNIDNYAYRVHNMRCEQVGDIFIPSANPRG